MSDIEDRLFELKVIKRILSIAHSDKLDAYLNEIIKTPNRRNMWIIIDGQRMQNDIAGEVGVSQMAVSKFLKVVSDAGLVEYEQGKPPRKLIDHIPADWLKDANEE